MGRRDHRWLQLNTNLQFNLDSNGVLVNFDEARRQLITITLVKMNVLKPNGAWLLNHNYSQFATVIMNY